MLMKKIQRRNRMEGLIGHFYFPSGDQGNPPWGDIWAEHPGASEHAGHETPPGDLITACVLCSRQDQWTKGSSSQSPQGKDAGEANGAPQLQARRPRYLDVQTDLTVVHFADTACFINWRCAATLHWASLSAPLFPIVSAYFVFPCCILVILAVFQTFSLSWYLLRWSGISDEPCPYETANLTDKCVCSDCLTSHSISLPLLRLPYSLRHNDTEIRWVNNPALASVCSSERKSHMSLTLNLKARHD